ncbi:sigma 54-interacting transcriptional regulator [bacterium]|nr:sigma 54-interacting transcriptional regulator [FCB group bacterium]MBL7191862.1 sigma 54-interacting transcriptional regulator [bacterium]
MDNPLHDLALSYRSLIFNFLLDRLKWAAPEGYDFPYFDGEALGVYNSGGGAEAHDLVRLASFVKTLIQNGRELLKVEDSGAYDSSSLAAKSGMESAETEELDRNLGQHVERYRFHRSRLINFKDRISGSRLVGRNSGWLNLLAYASKIAATDAPVVITGETGTGKEEVAKYIHDSSPRGENDFIPVNCGAIPDNLMESELFGYVSGAFTGANQNGRIGRLESAAGGTLFLDEVNELSPRLQTALLRFIEKGEIQKIGASKMAFADVRVICATNQDLKAKVRNGVFRKDLYYRLNIFHLHTPPLRERRDDIPLFIHYFLRQIGQKFRPQIHYTIEETAVSALQNYNWPGNLRELYAILLRASAICENSAIMRHHIIFDDEAADSGYADNEPERFSEIIRTIQNSGFNKENSEKLAGFLTRFYDCPITNSDYSGHFNVSSTTARNRLNQLTGVGILRREGSNKGRRYFIKDKF